MGKIKSELEKTQHTKQRSNQGKIISPLKVVRADTGMIFSTNHPSWTTIGDAALSCDPLAGDGVVRAVRSAIQSISMITDQLEGNGTTLPDESKLLFENFRDCLDLRCHYYQAERRFKDGIFWKRRQQIDWKNIKIFLDPECKLQLLNPNVSQIDLADVEMLIPPYALKSLFRMLRQPVLAHELLANLRTIAPLEDRRLLVGVQALVEIGVLGMH